MLSGTVEIGFGSDGDTVGTRSLGSQGSTTSQKKSPEEVSFAFQVHMNDVDHTRHEQAGPSWKSSSAVASTNTKDLWWHWLLGLLSAGLVVF